MGAPSYRPPPPPPPPDTDTGYAMGKTPPWGKTPTWMSAPHDREFLRRQIEAEFRRRGVPMVLGVERRPGNAPSRRRRPRLRPVPPVGTSFFDRTMGCLGFVQCLIMVTNPTAWTIGVGLMGLMAQPVYWRHRFERRRHWRH